MKRDCCHREGIYHYNFDMSNPLDEHALDFLDADVKRVIKDMLKAVVEHANVYNNGFKIERLRNAGFRNFLGTTGHAGPFINNQVLPVDVGGLLVHYGFAGERRMGRIRWPAVDRSPSRC